MNPSSGHNTNTYLQPSQFRSLYQPTTSQPQLIFPGIPPVYSDLTTLSSTRPNDAQPHIPSPSFRALRPQLPSELGERAQKSLGDAARPFKVWLRMAEDAKRDANRFHEQGDFESAFLEFVRAATIILQKIPSHPDYRVLISRKQRHNIGMHGQETLDNLAEIKPFLLERWKKWQANNPSSDQIQYAPAPVSHLPAQELVARSSIQSHGVSRNGVHTHFRTRSNDSLSPHKQVAGSVPPVASVSSFQSREPPDVANVPSTTLAGVSEALEMTAKLLNDEDELETDSILYSPSFILSDTTSIASYKTERSINSRKSRYNALPRRKYAGIVQPRLPTGLVSEDVGEVEASEPKTELCDESSSSLLGTIPIALKTNFVESGPNVETQLLDQPLKIHGSSIYGISIVKTASQLERTINHWASEVLRIAPAPAATLQEAVLADITDVGESTALFSDVRQLTVQFLLRHALNRVISEGIVNSLVVTNSAEENVGLTRVHERLLTRNLATAAVWRRHTFSIAVEFLRPELLRMIFEQNMPLLAEILPDSVEDTLGTRGVLEDAFKFSCMLRGTNADADALYRSFIPKFGSTLNSGLVELVKPCRRSESGEVDRVGVTIFPGLVELLPTLPIVQTVVRRAQVICECGLLANSDAALAPPLPPLPLPTM